MIKNILTLLFICFSYTLFSQAFTATWNTNNTSTGSSTVNEITIPTNSAFTYNYSIDWGDTNSDSNITGNITHTYATSGTYTISITGTFPAIYFNNTGDRNKIIEITSWGTIPWQSMENAFYGCENLNFDAIAAPNLSQVTFLKNMFRGCTTFNGIVNNWDTSTITDISGIFAGCQIFNRPLENWKTINVTDMSEVFSGAYLFNEPLDNWNTASVTNMNLLFSTASRFNQNINNWDVSQVTNMSGAFRYANRFNQPLNNWNVSNVTDMSRMFEGSDFDYPLNNWNVSKVTNMSGMFSQYSKFNQNIDNWDVTAVTNMSQMFHRATVFNQPLNSWKVDNVTNMSQMFDGFLIAMVFNQPLNNWNVNNVTNMSYMFRDCDVFNQPLNTWIVDNVTNMSGMFEHALTFNQDITGWNVSNVTNMSTMFQETLVFNQNINIWNVSNVTNMSSMFNSATVFNEPLDTWNLIKVTNISNMFSQATAFNQDISGWNTSAVTNMSSVFNSAGSFNQNLGTWNISAVTNMTNMLSNSGISQANYDATLIAWSAQTVKPNITLGANNLQYCDALNQRQSLITDDGWTIIGDSVNCTYVLCTQIMMPHASDTATPANSDIRWNPAPNATGYRITIRRINGATNQIIYNNEDVGNVVGVNFTNEFTPGDTVYVTVIPYNNDGPATGCQEISFTVVDSWVNSPDAFKLTYDTTLQEGTTTTPINQLIIQTQSGFTYDYNIDWGDGQYDNNITGNITHTYLTPGIYTVSIIGTFPSPRHNQSSGDAYKLLTIDQWGTQDWKSMNNAFAGCENMEYNATDIPNLTNVTDMSSMFIVCRKFNGDINNWNVSNVTNMYGVFGVASIFNQPLNNWIVSNVTNMNFMFSGASEFNQNINNWDTGKVTNIARMFRQATVFNQPLNSWDVSSTTDMSQMFSYTDAFNQPLNNWQVQNVLDMEDMFFYAKAFNQNINSWNVNNVLNMSSMFSGATVFNQPLNSWDVAKVTNMSSMFSSASAFNQPLDNWTVTSVTTMASMFSSATSFNQNINPWNVTNVINMQSMFNYATAFNQPLDNWNVDSVVNMSSMFQRASSFNQPLKTWNVSAVANMTSMFESAIVFDQSLSNWDVSSVTLMKSMFESASVFNQNLNTWDVGVVTTMEEMFKATVLFNEPLNSWDTGEVLSMKEMFSGASVFNQNINSWDVSFVTTMEEMFKDASTYNETMNSWNVASVATMKGMFQNAIAFNSTIDSWNVRKVLTMENMFYGATNFNQTVNSWRVSGVTTMNSMFRNATAFNQTLDRWDIGTVTMRYLMDGATAYNQYLGDWNIANVTDMRDALDRTALTRENYDNTLIAWSEQTLTPGVTLGAQGLPYCDAVEERQAMITNYGWTISDDILDCPIPECTQLISPLNGAVDVPVNTNLSWEPALFARGYRLTVISNPGNITVVNNVTVNDTNYEFLTDFTGGETVLVTIIPFNDEGDAVGPCTEEIFTISTNPAAVPDCTNLTIPLNNAVDIAINTDLTWQPIANADGYKLTIGITSGGNEILDNENVGNVTTYDLVNDLPENTQIFITITPFNSEGDAIGCSEEYFTTELIPVAPGCTSLISPINGAINVVIDTDLSWNAVSNATGYLVIVGTTQGGIETVNNVDVLNTLTYNIPDDLLPNRTYYVTIIPYNEVGDAVGCTEESFRTGASTLSDPPACTALSSPLNNAVDVAISTNITWNAASNATGYNVTIGTSTGASDILTTTNVGNVTTYNPPADLPEITTIYISVVPFNAFGNATSCTESSFTTETVPTIPNCTSLTNPLNNTTNVPGDTNLSWNAISDATGYTITIGTSSGASDILTPTDVSNVTTYNPLADLPEATTIYVSIVPYNTVGNATSCVESAFTTETLPTIPNCTSVTSPLNNATNVSVDANISWNAVSDATGYNISIGTSSGASDILITTDVGNFTTYNLASNLPETTTIYVTVVPYNTVGNATSCSESSFTTETVPVVPDCTSLTNPLNNNVDVSIDTNLSWNAVSDATGYRLTVGTISGASDILLTTDVGNVTTYNLTSNLPETTTIYVSIVPYNMEGNATNCNESSFTTETIPVIPNCTTLTNPLNTSEDIPVDTSISWEDIPNTDGYHITIGTTSGGNNILNNEDVGFSTTYYLTQNLPFNTTIYVSIIPYNSVGDAAGCVDTSFTTEIEPLVESEYGFSPNGDGINDFWEIKGIENSPQNTVNIFNRWGDLVFSIENYNNQANVFRGDANKLTKMGASSLPSGTYFFDIQITGSHNLKKLKGFLVLKR